MLYILFIVIFLVGSSLIFLANLDGNYEVKRSQLYDEDINTVFDKLCDFRSWRFWSPWLVHEPEATLEYSDNCNEEGGYYTWDGKAIGAGKLSHEELNSPNAIKQKLQFTRPFKSVCQVNFDLTELDGQTQVTWSMQGKMPFLMRFMIPRMKNMIGQDYSFGLAMLAGELNADAKHPKLSFVGEKNLNSRQCLCESFQGYLKDMPAAMEQGFAKLMNHAEEQGIKLTGNPFSAYHKVDIKKQFFVCDMALPVSSDIEPGEFQLKTIGAGKYYQADLVGSYEFLEQAWYSIMAHVHMFKFKLDKSRPSLEIYENDPNSVSSSNELKTTLFVPIK